MDRRFNTRIERVLKILLRPNFKPKTEAQLNSLLMFLTTDSDDGPVLSRKEQLWMAWFEEAIIKWEHIEKVPDPQVLKFTFNILTWVCQQEEMFKILTSNNLPVRLISIASKTEDPVSTQMDDEIVKLLSSIIDHHSGLQWILKSKYWESVMIKEINYQTRDNSNAVGQFIAKLIKRSAAFNDVSCEIVVQTILRNLIGASKEVTAVHISINIVNGYNLFGEVLHDLMEYQIATKNEIFKLFTDKHDLEKCVHTSMSASSNDVFLYNLYKILVILSFSKIYVKLITNTVNCQGEVDFPTEIFEILCDAANNLSLKNFLNLLNTIIGYWKLLKPEMPSWLKLALGNQLASLLAFPATIYVFGTFKSIFSEVGEQGDIRSYYARNILKFLLPETFRTFPIWRGDSTMNICLSPGILTLQHLLNSLRHYDHFEGVCLFHFLVENIKETNHVMKRRRDLVASFLKQPEYIALLLQCITELIEYFSISWNESVEALYILEYIYDFLSYLDWPTNIVVKGLELVEMAISRNMSPQMALLIDVDDYSVKPFAPMLSANLNNPDWKIRKCSVSLIGTISKNAITKYPSSRKLLMEYDFPCLVLKVAIVDGSPHVRAVALKCLQEMTQIKEFSDVLFNEYDILRTTIYILRTARDGIVRAEASLLLNFIYQHRKLPEDTLTVLFKLMSHVAVKDSEMEVRIKSLHFWKSVIDTHLTKHGMIDGTFPSVIFCEKLHKIVNLSGKEIKKILIEVLHNLAANGCLSVFHAALHDVSEPDFNEYARNYINDFVTMLTLYKVTSADLPLELNAIFPTSPETRIVDLSSRTTAHVPSNGNYVRMDFTILDECNAILYESHFHRIPNNFAKLKTVTAAEFIEYISSVSHKNTEKREKWDDFDSLLNELLNENNLGSETNMDII